jgi:predicted nucleotidyltransferase
METGLSGLPAPVKTRLDELEAALVTILGDDLDALLVYGSAARGDYRAGESDVDVMLVLKDDPEAKLEAIGAALQLARFAARIEVMILRKDEIPRAADCFPLLYDDIARASIVLRGKSPFDGLEIHGEHKRLRIEQELREARIRLRRVVADMAAEESFGRAIERKVKQIRGPLWALLALRGDKVEDRLEPVLQAAARVYSLDLGPLRRAREAARPAHDALVKLLDAALEDVDRREGATR